MIMNMKNLNVSALIVALLFSLGMNGQSVFIDTKPDKTVQEGETFLVDTKTIRDPLLDRKKYFNSL